MFARIHKLLQGCLLSCGVSNRTSLVAVAQPIAPQLAVATCETDEGQCLDDQLSAWEQDRAATLRDADENEQQGLRHLTKAAILRLVMQFEDEGLFVVAHDLRQQVDALDRKRATYTIEQPLTAPTF